MLFRASSHIHSRVQHIVLVPFLLAHLCEHLRSHGLLSLLTCVKMRPGHQNLSKITRCSSHASAKKYSCHAQLLLAMPNCCPILCITPSNSSSPSKAVIRLAYMHSTLGTKSWAKHLYAISLSILNFSASLPHSVPPFKWPQNYAAFRPVFTHKGPRAVRHHVAALSEHLELRYVTCSLFSRTAADSGRSAQSLSSLPRVTHSVQSLITGCSIYASIGPKE